MNEQSQAPELNLEKYKNQSALMDACIANVEKARAQRDHIVALQNTYGSRYQFEDSLDSARRCVQISENTLLTQIRIINLENQSDINEKASI